MTVVHDVHAHCVPGGLVETIRSSGPRAGVDIVMSPAGPAVRFAGGPTTPPILPGLTDVGAMLADMDRARIDVRILSPWTELTAYGLGADDALRFSRWFNDLLAGTIAEHPDRLRGLGTVPLQAPGLAVRELERCITELGFVGVEIATTVAGRDLDDPALDPFWAAASEIGCPILIHPLHPLQGRDQGRHYLANLVGNPAETTLAAAALMFGGVLDRFPGIRPILVHGGGFTPWQIHRWDRGHDAMRGLTRTGGIRSRPSELLRRFHFDSVLHGSDQLAFLIGAVGADRVVIGTDHPFPMGDPDPLWTLDGVTGLDPEAIARVRGGNVMGLIAGIGG